jgi:hypothetical protein
MTDLTVHPNKVHTEHAHESRVGLHGHSFQIPVLRAAVAEGIRTFVLVLTIITTVIAATLNKPVAGPPFGFGEATESGRRP